MALIYPLIILWQVNYWVPVQCPKGGVPDSYLQSCLQQAKITNSLKITEKQDYEKWVKDLPKNDPRFTITNIEVYSLDDTKKLP